MLHVKFELKSKQNPKQQSACLGHEVFAVLREVAWVEGIPSLNQPEGSFPAPRPNCKYANNETVKETKNWKLLTRFCLWGQGFLQACTRC